MIELSPYDQSIGMDGKQVEEHYDRLIAENNDPVLDSEPLRAYMDKWDGQDFINKMNLCKKSTVLEIGVGTGRLAVRVVPLCGEFYGIDVSSKTISRAKEHLEHQPNVTLIYGDFLSYHFRRNFDVIYSSLTFMHIRDKKFAVKKAASLLNPGGKFVLSIDKDQEKYIDIGKSSIEVFPDTPDKMASYIENSDMVIAELYETKFAYIFVCTK